MKSFFKLSVISLIVTGMAGSVYAAPTPINYDTWSPQFSGGFLGVEGLYLRPMNGDLDYVTLLPTSSGGSFVTKNVDTSHDWGWRVYGGVNFTDHDDITLSWMQLRTQDSDSVSPSGYPDLADTAVARWLDGSNIWSNVWGRATFDLDEAYAVWGHTINFNNPWSIRYAAGIEYAKVYSKLRITADSVTEGLSTIGFESKSDAKGIGPRVEFDMTYHLPYGFALFANTNAALLASKRNISLNPFVNSVEDAEGDLFEFSVSDFSTRHVVIPKFGMRLGASYSYLFGQSGGEGVCRGTILTVEAGWQVESYIHAIERPDEGYFSFETSSVPAALTQIPANSSFASTKTSNFSDQGLFVGIKLGMDWM